MILFIRNDVSLSRKQYDQAFALELPLHVFQDSTSSAVQLVRSMQEYILFSKQDHKGILNSFHFISSNC
jgi:hypothetical protein